MSRTWAEDRQHSSCDIPFDGVTYRTREGALRVEVSWYSDEGVTWHVWDTDSRHDVLEVARHSRRREPLRTTISAGVLARGTAGTIAIAKIKALAAARRLAPSRALPAPQPAQ